MPRVEDALGSISEVDVVGSVQWRGRVRGESSGGGFGGAFRQCHNAHWEMARERVWTNLAIGQHAVRRGSRSDARLVVASQRGGLASKQATDRTLQRWLLCFSGRWGRPRGTVAH